MDAALFDGWIPTRLYWEQDRPLVDWRYVGATRFTEPFFDQTIMRCFRHPFSVLFARHTPIGALAELAEARPGLAPSGFIFHMSRCGSTLVTRMLGALPHVLAFSEAVALDQALRAHYSDPGVTDEQRADWLRWLVGALGQPRQGQERSLVIKFDSWHTHFLPIVRRAFPDTPCIFLYRDPIEVLVSHRRGRGSQMIPGMLPPALFGLDPDTIFQMPQDEYCARVLASICDAALEYHQPGRDWFIPYERLPEAVWSALLDLFAIDHAPDDLGRMRDVTQFHAKTPSFFFTADAQDKRQEATGDLRALADRFVRPLYERIDALRASEEDLWTGKPT